MNKPKTRFRFIRRNGRQSVFGVLLLLVLLVLLILILTLLVLFILALFVVLLILVITHCSPPKRSSFERLLPFLYLPPLRSYLSSQDAALVISVNFSEHLMGKS